MKQRLRDFEPFTVELGGVEVFPETRVIYLAIRSGFHHLVRMHDLLNQGPAAFVEPFHYHPHITLAQDLDDAAFDRALSFCQRRWMEFGHSRRHTVERLTFVQNTLTNSWTDLAAMQLTSHVAR